jgi:hypothetical protein
LREGCIVAEDIGGVDGAHLSVVTEGLAGEEIFMPGTTPQQNISS